MSQIIDVLIAIALTQSLGMARAPLAFSTRTAAAERSVWTNYVGLYKLQQVSEICSRLNTCGGPKAALTWAPILLSKSVTPNKEIENAH